MEGASVSTVRGMERGEAVPWWPEFVSVVLLSVAALASAWCTFQAELWNGIPAEKPRRNRDASSGPLDLPQYRREDEERVKRLHADMLRTMQEGHTADARGDAYVRITVFLAAVLFLAGISQQIASVTLRETLM